MIQSKKKEIVDKFEVEKMDYVLLFKIDRYGREMK